MSKVSVCIPAFNGQEFLGEAIDSVLGQSLRDLELVVVDDGSTDATPRIIAERVRADARIKAFRNEENQGMVASWNRSLALATGDYVKLMGHDDVLEPDCLERSARALDEHPGAALAACARTLIDARGRVSGERVYPGGAGIVDGARAVRDCLLGGGANLIGEPVAVLFRRALSARGFDAGYRQFTDLEMWFHLLEQGGLLVLEERLCRFRRHPGQESEKNDRSLAVVDDAARLGRAYLGKGYVGASFLDRQRWRFDLAHAIWDHRRLGADPRLVDAKLREYCGPPALYHILHLAYRLKVRLTGS